MKALLLIENEQSADIIRFYLKPLGFEAIRYRNPLKALDNLEEIAPEAVIVSARDYPRHWKVIADVVRSARNKSECVLILLRGENFSYEEAAKATHLGVNGVVADRLEDRREQAQFQRLLKRYVAIEDAREAERVSPSPWDRLDFMFSHPETLIPVAGILETLSLGGLSFRPEPPSLAEGLREDLVLEDCSLRAGDHILSPTCRVLRPGYCLGLAFVAMDEAERHYLADYLASCPEREIHALAQKKS